MSGAATAGAPQGEECPICRDVFNDPVMCADGFCYCRACVATWVGYRREWTSPLTNCTHFGPALLTPDLIRAGSAKGHLRAQVREMEGVERLLRTAFARFGLAPLCTAKDCADLIEDSTYLALARAGAATNRYWLPYLELCWRAGRMDAFPGDFVRHLCLHDRSGSECFLQRHVICVLLSVLAMRYQSSPTIANQNATILGREHYKWRLEQVDAIYVPTGRAPGPNPHLLLRASLSSEMGEVTTWKGKDGAVLHVPTAALTDLCTTETAEVELAPKRGSSTIYRSRAPVRLQGSRLWARRRGPASPPFPEYSGLSPSAESVSSESSESTASSSSSDTSEAEEEPAPEPAHAAAPPPPATPPPELSIDAAVRDGGALSVWEVPLRALPDGFEYVCRVADSDSALDEGGTLALANETLLTGLLQKKGRRPETLPTRRTKRRVA